MEFSMQKFAGKNIEIIALTVGEMRENCYLLADKNTKQTIIIDPGDDAEYLEDAISRYSLIPKLIVATHGHGDHLGAGLALQLAYKIPFVLHPNDHFLLAKSNGDFGKQKAYFYPIPDKKQNNLKEISLGHTKIQLFLTPGHTPGSICLYLKSENILFCGDSLFAGGFLGRTDFYYSDKNQYQKTLCFILQFPGETILLPGHGGKTRIKDEKGHY